MKILTAARLREVLNYNPLTGIFRWRMVRGRVKAGSIAGCVRINGYRQFSIDGRKYLAGRLAWLFVHGCWPEGEIDHKNTIRDDNRLKNLRDITHQGNTQNRRRAQRNSQTGLLGVYAHQGKFRASIGLNGKQRHIGTFATPEAAHAAYVAAKRRLHSTCTI